MIIGFTGTQKGMTNEQKYHVSDYLETLKPKRVHHGECVGADAEFHRMCQIKGIDISGHPPTIKKKQAKLDGYFLQFSPKPYLDRNHDIVDDCDFLLACPKEQREVVRSGTWATVRYAIHAKKRVVVILPDGTEVNWNNNPRIGETL